MVKASANSVATSNEDVADEPTGSRVIAEWIGDAASPRIKGSTSRELTKAQVKDGLLMTLTRDLTWTHATAYRADVTDESDAFKDWLHEQKEFKVTEED